MQYSTKVQQAPGFFNRDVFLLFYYFLLWRTRFAFMEKEHER